MIQVAWQITSFYLLTEREGIPLNYRIPERDGNDSVGEYSDNFCIESFFLGFFKQGASTHENLRILVLCKSCLSSQTL